MYRLVKLNTTEEFYASFQLFWVLYCQRNHILWYFNSSIILPVVLYGCETWPLTIREEPRLRVFEIRVLRRIFGPKRDKVTREWRKLDNAELNDLCCSPNIVRVIKSK
jgi:hypothetical protein